MRAWLSKEEKAERAEMVERNERYAKANRLEIIFSAGHRFYEVIYYDSLEGKYYHRGKDMLMENEEIKAYGLGA